MLTQTHRQRNHIPGAALCGRVEIADHVMFASASGDDWCVVVNGVIVDHHTNRFAALDLISRLAQALRLGETMSPSLSSGPQL